MGDLIGDLVANGYGDDLRQARAERGCAWEAREGKVSLKSLRLRAGLSQADLAGAIGWSQPAIARLEGEEKPNPQLSTLVALAAALGTDLDTLRVALNG